MWRKVNDCQTTVHVHNSQKKRCLQPTSKYGEAGQWGDGVWQVVTDAGCGGTERPVAERRMTCLCDQRRAQPSSTIYVHHMMKLGEVWPSIV